MICYKKIRQYQKKASLVSCYFTAEVLVFSYLVTDDEKHNFYQFAPFVVSTQFHIIEGKSEQNVHQFIVFLFINYGFLEKLKQLKKYYRFSLLVDSDRWEQIVIDR